MATGRDERTARTKELTSKQLHFARAVASGLSQAAAYREAYNCSGSKQATIHQRACELAKDSRIAARIKSLIAQKEARMLEAGVNDRHRVLSDLRILAASATPIDGNRIRALELLGKTCGAFMQDSAPQVSRTAAELAEELESALASLVSDSIPPANPEAEQDDGSAEAGAGEAADGDMIGLLH